MILKTDQTFQIELFPRFGVFEELLDDDGDRFLDRPSQKDMQSPFGTHHFMNKLFRFFPRVHRGEQLAVDEARLHQVIPDGFLTLRKITPIQKFFWSQLFLRICRLALSRQDRIDLHSKK